jgi:hypothetical protein
LSPSPIRSAKRRLKNLQEDDVNEALCQIRFGIAPAIHLPASISDPSSNHSRHDDRGTQSNSRNNGRSDERKKNAASPSESRHENRNPTPTYLANGKYQRDKDMETSSTQ